MIRSSSTGSLATIPLFFLGPSGRLREPEERSPATRTNLLKVPPGSQLGIELEAEPELRFDEREIADHRGRSERTPTSPTLCLFASFTDVFVERDAELRRTLKDMEEFSERKK
jgi:hypothetical protein